jgi:hypothetical protein
MNTHRRATAALAFAAISIAVSEEMAAHAGPPFPIVSDRLAGAYHVSVWTDPDATSDGSLGGQFWVLIRMIDGSPLSADTRADVTVRPLDRSGPPRSAHATPVDGEVSRQFAVVLMDHEGRFSVNTTISGPGGPAAVHAEVDATYDLRPSRYLLVLYVMPFLAVGFLWLKLLRRRRESR